MISLTSLWTRFNGFLVQSKRVFLITKKPNKFELKTIVKISGIGIILIGVIGFIITIIGQASF